MKGFSLIEIMLVMGIVLTVGFLAGAFPLRLVIVSEIHDATSELGSAFHKAQSYALAGREHSAWGVHYGNSAVTVFKGDSYSDREQSFDETTKINDKIVVSGFSNLIFVSPGGYPAAAISSITLSRNGVEAEMKLNNEGILDKN